MRNPLTNRRAFLASTSAAAAAVTIAKPLLAQQPSSRRKIRKAVKFQMVTEKLSVLDKFKLLKDIGFDGTEIPTGGKFERREIADAIAKTGLKVHGVINAADPNLADAIHLAKDLGGDSVLVVAEQDARQTYEQNFEHWQNLIRSVLDLAEKNSVRLLIENVRATFLKSAEEMVRFIDSFDSPFVAAYFDTGNAITWTVQSAQYWAAVLEHRIGKLDIKDRGHPEFGDTKLRSKTAVGTDGGEVHWQDVRKQLTRINFSGWATAEVRGGDRKRLAGIAAWMDAVLGQ